MSECGEDLLVDLSEILFNELAFFRLMQNLDTTNTKVKERLRTFAKVAAVRSLQILLTCQCGEWRLDAFLSDLDLVSPSLVNINRQLAFQHEPSVL